MIKKSAFDFLVRVYILDRTVDEREEGMTPSMHMEERMGQRGIGKQLVDLALEYGQPDGDRFVLSQRDIRAQMDACRQELKALERAYKKGGITVVATGETLITAFRTNSYKRTLRK